MHVFSFCIFYFMDNLFPDYNPYTRQEEHEAFLVVRAGEAAEKEMSREGLSDEEKERLFAAAEKGKQAREDIILHNTKLASSYIIKRCYYLLDVHPDWEDDLFMVAILGIDRAIDLFDVDSGYKFSTYAHQWIRNKVNEYICRESYLLRYQRDLYILINKYKNFCSEYEQYTGDIPDDRTVIEKLHIKPEKLYIIKDAIAGQFDLDEKINDDDDDEDETFGDFVDSGISVERSVEQDLLRDEVQKRLDVLTPVEKFFVQLYYGIGTDSPRKLRDVEKMLGYKKGSGSEVLNRAYKKLKPYFDPSFIGSVCHV